MNRPCARFFYQGQLLGYTMGQEMKLDKKLNRIVREINEIRKDVVILKLASKPQHTKKRTKAWKALARKVSSRWQGPTAVEEIASQREKAW